MSSAGSSSPPSTSTASRSRTAFAYSLRLRRCSTTCSGRCAGPAPPAGPPEPPGQPPTQPMAPPPGGVLEPGDEGVDGRSVGLPSAGRRHDAPTKLAHRLFEHVGALTDTF